MDQMEAMPAPPREPPWREFARAPLAPIALGTAAGLALERFAGLPLEVYFAVTAIGLIVWAAARQRPRQAHGRARHRQSRTGRSRRTQHRRRSRSRRPALKALHAGQSGRARLFVLLAGSAHPRRTSGDQRRRFRFKNRRTGRLV